MPQPTFVPLLLREPEATPHAFETNDTTRTLRSDLGFAGLARLSAGQQSREGRVEAEYEHRAHDQAHRCAGNTQAHM